MPEWYEVFDNEEVLFQTRKHVAKLTAVLIAAFVISLGVMLALVDHFTTPDRPAPLYAVFPVFIPLWLAPAVRAVRRLARLRRMVWCLKVSGERVVGYDYARRKTVIPWPDAARLDLKNRSLLLVSREGPSLEVLHLFPDFPALSHRMLEYAEEHGVSVYLNGQPWEALDVYSLFPFISGGEAAQA